MRTVTVEQPCSAPADLLWHIATDLEHVSSVIPDITGTQVLTEQPFGVGTRWRETRTMMGRAATEEMTITAVDPGRSYTAEAQSSGMRYLTTWRIDPTDDGSRITMTFGGEPATRLARLAGPVMALMARSVESAMRKDMAALARAAEQRAGH